jgi:hypothetical protein
MSVRAEPLGLTALAQGSILNKFEMQHMLGEYLVNGEQIDSLELKVLLITKGVHVSANIYEQFAKTHRISPNPVECNCIVLPGDIVVHLADIGPNSPFSLEIAENGNACLFHKGIPITEVSFPPKTEFYRQCTSSGRPFLGMAVLQGLDVLSFPYLWPCIYPPSGQACQFCHCGGISEQMAHAGIAEPSFPAAQDVADVVNYAFTTERLAKCIQITGGSLADPEAEFRLAVEALLAIGGIDGFENIPSEISVFTSPAKDPVLIDQLFEAGANRVACDIEIWDEALAERICPGKAQSGSRVRYIKTLLYIVNKYGPNKACSTFVVGLEPVESFLSGAEFLAARGIVPCVSIWMPHGRPVLGKTEAPGLDYYRRVRDGIAKIYDKYKIVPPGGFGFNVCLCRDTWNHCNEILAHLK